MMSNDWLWKTRLLSDGTHEGYPFCSPMQCPCAWVLCLLHVCLHDSWLYTCVFSSSLTNIAHHGLKLVQKWSIHVFETACTWWDSGGRKLQQLSRKMAMSESCWADKSCVPGDVMVFLLTERLWDGPSQGQIWGSLRARFRKYGGYKQGKYQTTVSSKPGA